MNKISVKIITFEKLLKEGINTFYTNDDFEFKDDNNK